MASRNKDLSQEVYTHLREAILSSELFPGHKLSHQVLAKRFGVSSTPLREAFNKLAQDGYIRHIQNRGYFVSDFSRREVEELLEIRQALEMHAIRPAMDNLTNGSLEGLRATQETYEKAVDKGSDAERLKFDRAFHLELTAISGNQTLGELLGQIFDRVNLKRHVNGLSPERGLRALEEHRAILAGLESGDFPKARSALQRHLKKNRESVLSRMQEAPSHLRRIR